MTYTRVRDCLCLAVGLGGLIYQQVTQSYNATLVAAFLSLVLTPGGIGVATLLRHGWPSSNDGGQSSQSAPHSPGPAPPLSASSSREAGDP